MDVTDLLAELERLAWLEYWAAVEQASAAWQETFIAAWETAQDDAELEALTAGPEAAWQAVHGPAWAKYCQMIGRR